MYSAPKLTHEIKVSQQPSPWKSDKDFKDYFISKLKYAESNQLQTMKEFLKKAAYS